VGVGGLATLPVLRYQWQKISGTIKSGENQSGCSSTMYSTRNSTLAALGLDVDLLIVNLAKNCLTYHKYCTLWLLMVLRLLRLLMDALGNHKMKTKELL